MVGSGDGRACTFMCAYVAPLGPLNCFVSFLFACFVYFCLCNQLLHLASIITLVLELDTFFCSGGEWPAKMCLLLMLFISLDDSTSFTVLLDVTMALYFYAVFKFTSSEPVVSSITSCILLLLCFKTRLSLHSLSVRLSLHHSPNFCYIPFLIALRNLTVR